MHTCCQKSARRGFLAKIFKAAWKDFLLTSVLEIYPLVHEDNEEATTHQHQHLVSFIPFLFQNFHFPFKLRDLRPRASFFSGYSIWWLCLYVRTRDRAKHPIYNLLYNRELQIAAIPKADWMDWAEHCNPALNVKEKIFTISSYPLCVTDSKRWLKWVFMSRTWWSTEEES